MPHIARSAKRGKSGTRACIQAVGDNVEQCTKDFRTLTIEFPPEVCLRAPFPVRNVRQAHGQTTFGEIGRGNCVMQAGEDDRAKATYQHLVEVGVKLPLRNPVPLVIWHKQSEIVCGMSLVLS